MKLKKSIKVIVITLCLLLITGLPAFSEPLLSVAGTSSGPFLGSAVIDAASPFQSLFQRFFVTINDFLQWVGSLVTRILGLS